MIYNKKLVTYEEAFEQFHQPGMDINEGWALEMMQHVQKKFPLVIQGKIAVAEIGNLVMPHHSLTGCCMKPINEEYEIIPPSGLRLADAHQTLVDRWEEFQTKAQHCYEKISNQINRLTQGEDLGFFYFTESPLMIGSSYEEMTDFEGKITHLDGLHRLIAIMFSDKKPKYINVFVGVKENSPLLSE